ncbi:MAG: formylglycine-generating enzyme family protein [Brachymonas sp.]|nr:formylglycine-generating enzyme family protein [Brachymonas sp.]
MKFTFKCLFLSFAMSVSLNVLAQKAGMQRIGRFEIDITEVTVGEFQRFAQATRHVTAAERTGGNTFEAGWEQRKGWNWRTPFGSPASNTEPALHINYPEAAAFCAWVGKRLPTDSEWGEAAYTERRTSPTDGLITGRTYAYPTGDSPQGANCLGDCGSAKTVAHAVTSRGKGHSEVATTRRGVNGLFDMGGNVWEWVDSGAAEMKRTRGGSWWYGAASMKDDHQQSKPASMSAVYIGFRCARDVR